VNTQSQKKIDRRARLKLPPIHAGQRSAEERVRDFEEILVLHTPALAQAEAEVPRPKCPANVSRLWHGRETGHSYR